MLDPRQANPTRFIAHMKSSRHRAIFSAKLVHLKNVAVQNANLAG